MAPNGEQGAKRPKVDDKSRIIRPLGHTEKMQSALHNIRQMCSTVVTCRYAIPPSLTQPQPAGSSNVRQDALENVVTDAVANTILEHPMLLVAQIKEDSAQPSWIRIDSIQLDEHITWITAGRDEDYETRFQERTQWSLDTWYTDIETRPGWRLSIIRQAEDATWFDAIFSFNHAHFDGMGAKLFHETLLRQLNDVSNADTYAAPPYLAGHPRVLAVPSSLNLPPPQEKLVKHPLSAKYTAKTVWEELKPPFLGARKGKDNADWCPIQTDTHGSIYRHVIIGPDTTKHFLAACRSHKTTLTGLLHALCLVSLALQLEGKATSLASGTAFDHRRFMPTKPAAHPWYEPEKTMCNLVSIMRHVYSADVVNNIRSKCRSATSQTDILTVTEDIIWSAAGQTRQEIQHRLDLGLKDDLTGLLKFVKDWRAQMKENAKKARATSWAVTNLGAMDGGDGAWKITKAVFQLPAEQTAAAFGISCTSVKGGDCSVVINWQERTLDDSIGDKLASDLQIWLDHIGRTTEVNGAA